MLKSINIWMTGLWKDQRPQEFSMVKMMSLWDTEHKMEFTVTVRDLGWGVRD